MATYTKSERAEALARLRDWIIPGDTIYTVLEHVSRSRMQREIRLILLKCDGGKPVDLHPNHAAARVLGYRQGKRDGLIVGGCGMDMGFHVVYNLSRVLFAEYVTEGGQNSGGFYCVGKGCPSNDHHNGDRVYTNHKHSDPGYALIHRWL